MRRKKCRKLLAGMLCAIMIITNSVATGILVQATETNSPKTEAAGTEQSNESTESESETPSDKREGAEESEKSTGETGEASESSKDEIESGKDDTDRDKQENPGGEDNSEKSEGSKEEEENKEESGNVGNDGSGNESREGETETPGDDDDASKMDSEQLLAVSVEKRLRLMSSEGDIASGTYGDIAWVIDINGKLTVTGTGNYSPADLQAPWNGYCELIKTAEANITGISQISRMFYGCKNLITVNLGNLDTSHVTDMSDMFYRCENLVTVNLNNFDTRCVTDMSCMFWECHSLSKLDLSHFDTSDVQNMHCMFYECENLSTLDISHFNTSNVTDMAGMFEGCSNLTVLNLSYFNTSNVTDMGYMFKGCNGLTTLDVSHFNTSNVTDMAGMFEGCSNLTVLNLSYFNTSNVTDMGYMFKGCNRLTTLDVSHFNTSNVTKMYHMFESCSSLTTLDLSCFNTSNVTGMGYMFDGCSNLTTLNLSNFDTSNVTQMRDMFQGCSSLITLDLNNFDTSNVKEMSYMFDGCFSLTTLDLSHFNMQNLQLHGANYMLVFDLIETNNNYSLTSIYTPYNLSQSVVKLPTNSGDVWYRSDGTTVTELPQNLNYSVALGKNYIPEEITANPITSCIGGSISGKGISYGRVTMVYQGEPIRNKQVRWKFDDYDMDYKFGKTDKNGYFMLESPTLSYRTDGTNVYTLQATVSYFTGTDWLSSPEKYTMEVNVKPLTVSQKWQLKTKKSIEAGFGASIEGEIGPAKASASLGEISAAATAGGTLSLSHSYDEYGMRKLALMQTISGNVAAKYSLGPAASVDVGGLEEKVTLVGVKGTSSVGNSITYGTEILDYNPENPQHLLQVGKFLATAQMYNTGDVFLRNALELLGFDSPDIKGAGIKSSLSNGASAVGIEISDSNRKDLGFAANAISANYDRTYSTGYLINDCGVTDKHEIEIASDVKVGILNFDITKDNINGMPLVSVGATPQNTTINLETDKNGNLTKAEYTDKTYISWGVPFITNTTTNAISFSTSDAESLQKLGRVKNLQNIISRNNAVFFPERYITDTWNDIRNYTDTLDFGVSRNEASMLEVPMSFGLGLGIKASVGLDLSGSSEVSYVTQRGFTQNDSLYVTAEMQNEEADIDNAKMNASEIITEPLKAIGKKISEFVKDTAGKVADGVKEGCAWVGDTVSGGVDWVVHIISFKNDKMRTITSPQSFAIDTYMNTFSDTSETPGVSMTVGEPYLIYVTDASENEISDFTNHPLELRLDYDSTSLEAAGVTTDQASALAIYMYSEEKCGYIYLGGQVDTENQQVAVDITKPGQYLLAVDTLAPAIYDIYISDTSSKPIITAFFSELSGFSQFSMKIDGVEYVNETTLNQYLDQSSGSFVYKVETPLEDGEHTLSFTATDSRGNATAQPITFAFVVGEIPEDNPPEIGDILPEDMPEDGKIPDGLWIAAISDAVYTGKAIKPIPRVYDSNVRLQAGTDYTVTYKNNVKASDASNVSTAPTIIVTGKGNYSGKDTITFKILPIEFTESNMTVADMTRVYNQQIQEPIPTITVNGRKLKRQTDFFVSYPDYTLGAYRDIGTYRIAIMGTGNYTGEQILTFDITDKLLISKASVSKILNQAYTGNAVTPALVVKYQKANLVEHEDYELEYQSNIDIGKATVVIKGIGDYAGKKTVSFQITGESLKKAKVTGLVSPVVYTGEELLQNCSLSILVNDADIPLQEGKDYTVTYKNNIKAGTAKVIYTGINGYTGTLQKSYKITPYDILSNNSSYMEYTKDIVCTYLKGGSRPEPDLYFKGTLLKKGVDYTLSYRNNNAVRGEQMPTIIVKGKGSFKNKIEIPFTIEPQNLSNMALASCDKVYKDKADIYKITPKLIDLNGKALSAGKDFDKDSITYAYDSDVVLEDGTFRKAGDKVEATDIIPANTRIRVTLVCGSNNLYEGTFTGTYRIVAADIKASKVSIPAQTYTGSEIKPDKTQIRITLSEMYLSPEDYDIVSYANNIKKGKASVTVSGKGNYGGTKTVKFTIKAKGFLWWWR